MHTDHTLSLELVTVPNFLTQRQMHSWPIPHPQLLILMPPTISERQTRPVFLPSHQSARLTELSPSNHHCWGVSFQINSFTWINLSSVQYFYQPTILYTSLCRIGADVQYMQYLSKIYVANSLIIMHECGPFSNCHSCMCTITNFIFLVFPPCFQWSAKLGETQEQDNVRSSCLLLQSVVN